MGWRSWLYRSPERYDRMLQWLHGDSIGQRFQEIAALVGPQKRVLDLGAGTGTLAGFLNEGCAYVAADLNPDFLEHVRSNGHEALALDVFDFGGYPSDVDVVVAADLLHHLVPRVPEFLGGLASIGIGQVIVCESYPYGARLASRILGPIMDNDGFNNIPARLQHHLFDEFTEEGLREMYRDLFPSHRGEHKLLSERGNPGKERRGWETLISSFTRES